jgi:predicted PurR-regulated permease PerM
VGLLVWGFGVISTVDNFLRSILISQATQASMVLVFIGVVGGVVAFGLLGVFIGPALMSVAQTLWRDFAADRGPQPAPSA